MNSVVDDSKEGRNELKLASFLPYMLASLAQDVSTELSTIYAQQFELTVPEWRVLANLAEHDTLNARQIVETSSMVKSKVSRAVQSLDQRGLITQQTASGDARAKDLSLTEEGKALYRQIAPKALAWERSLLDGLTTGEYRDLMYLLEKLQTRVDEMKKGDE